MGHWGSSHSFIHILHPVWPAPLIDPQVLCQHGIEVPFEFIFLAVAAVISVMNTDPLCDSFPAILLSPYNGLPFSACSVDHLVEIYPMSCFGQCPSLGTEEKRVNIILLICGPTIDFPT